MARLLVSGPKALFRRPEISDAAVSYDVITPWAARRIFETVHWTPAIRWMIERIEVLKPINAEWSGSAFDDRRSNYLIAVEYAISARFEMTESARAGESAAQHAAMFKRRAQRKQLAHPAFLGQRGLHADVTYLASYDLLPSFYDGKGAIDLGWMIYDREHGDRSAINFFRATMVDGVIDLSTLDPSSMAR